MSAEAVTGVEVETLHTVVGRNQIWSRMAAKHDVTNPVPPWKTSLDGICDALDCNDEALSFLGRRDDEDVLAATVYSELPYPENQLVALAHSLVAHGVIDENALAYRMESVRTRLES